MPSRPADIPVPVALLTDALGPARRGVKEKGVHALRVATRRIDVWLRLAGLRVLRDDLRWLRGVAAPVRDLDVLVGADRAGGPLARLQSERVTARRSLVAALATRRPGDLARALSVLPPLPHAEGVRGARRLVRALLEMGTDPTDPAAVHRRRRALRRVRYAYELVGMPVDALVTVQDALGVVSDLWVRRLHLPETVSEEALGAALATAQAVWEREFASLEGLA